MLRRGRSEKPFRGTQRSCSQITNTPGRGGAMKFFAIFALSLIFSPIALSQDKEVIELKAEFEFGDGQGYIWWSRTLEGETKLLLVGERNIQLLDIENAKLLESRAVKLPEFRTRFRYDIGRASCREGGEIKVVKLSA